MKKKFVAVVLLGVLLVLIGCAKPIEKPEWQFEVGDDIVEYSAPEVTQWSPVFTVNLKVVGGNDTVLFNGKVKVTSDQQFVSEALKAALTDKALAQEGVDVGFVSKIGDYTNNSETNTYWMYYINGNTPAWGCNQLQMRDGDYILWTYEEVKFE